MVLLIMHICTYLFKNIVCINCIIRTEIRKADQYLLKLICFIKLTQQIENKQYKFSTKFTRTRTQILRSENLTFRGKMVVLGNHSIVQLIVAMNKRQKKEFSTRVFLLPFRVERKLITYLPNIILLYDVTCYND